MHVVPHLTPPHPQPSLQALGLWRPGVAIARTPPGTRKTKKQRRRSPAPFGDAHVQRPPTSGLHSAMAVSSGG